MSETNFSMFLKMLSIAALAGCIGKPWMGQRINDGSVFQVGTGKDRKTVIFV